MSGGRAFELPMLVPRITGNACSSSPHLPTPATQPATGNGHARNLGKEVQTMLPTPQASDWKRENNPSDNLRKSPSITAVDTHFPTPTASDATGGGQHPSKRVGHTHQLIDAVLSIGEPMAPLFDVGSD